MRIQDGQLLMTDSQKRKEKTEPSLKSCLCGGNMTDIYGIVTLTQQHLRKIHLMLMCLAKDMDLSSGYGITTD
jgi:hypothetical protein